MKKIKFSKNELLQLKIWANDIIIALNTENKFSDTKQYIEITTERLKGAIELKLSNLPNENNSISN